MRKRIVWVFTKKYRFYEILSQVSLISFRNVIFIPFLSMPIIVSEENFPDLVFIYDLPKEEWESLWLRMKDKGIKVYVICEKCSLPKGFPNKFCLRAPITLSRLENIVQSVLNDNVLEI